MPWLGSQESIQVPSHPIFGGARWRNALGRCSQACLFSDLITIGCLLFEITKQGDWTILRRWRHITTPHRFTRQHPPHPVTGLARSHLVVLGHKQQDLLGCTSQFKAASSRACLCTSVLKCIYIYIYVCMYVCMYVCHSIALFAGSAIIPAKRIRVQSGFQGPSVLGFNRIAGWSSYVHRYSRIQRSADAGQRDYSTADQTSSADASCPIDVLVSSVRCWLIWACFVSSTFPSVDSWRYAGRLQQLRADEIVVKVGLGSEARVVVRAERESGRER